jgi:hypothetical protein
MKCQTVFASGSAMSIADPGKEIRYFVIVRSSRCEFGNWAAFMESAGAWLDGHDYASL